MSTIAGLTPITSLCETLTERTGTKYIPAITQGLFSDKLKVIVYIGEEDGPWISEGDLLQRVIDVMTPEELERMGDELTIAYTRQGGLAIGSQFTTWLIKHNHSAFVAAALVAVGAGKGE